MAKKRGLEPETMQFCVVCGDFNAKRHYGNNCCSGCKGFFRRAIKNNKSYVCAADGQCIINKDLRNNCRACRYKKCIESGLDTRLIRQENVTKQKIADYNHALVRRNIYYHNRPSTSKHVDNFVPEDPEIFDVKNIEHIILTTNSNFEIPLGRMNFLPNFNSKDYNSVINFVTFIEKVCDTFSDCSITLLENEFENKCTINVSGTVAWRNPKLVSHRSKIEWNPVRYATGDIFRRLWCRVTTHYFDWVSCIPEIRLLTEKDQEILIISQCMSSISLLLAHRSYLAGCQNALVISSGTYFPLDKEEWNLLDPEIITIFQQMGTMIIENLLKPFIEINITLEELSMLRVINVFTQAPRLSKEGVEFVTKARNHYIEILVQFIAKSNPQDDVIALTKRVSTLMSFLPIVEKIAQMEDDTLAVMALFNMAQMRGTLPYDLHVRKNDPFSTSVILESNNDA